MADVPKLTEEQLKRAIPAQLLSRLMQGRRVRAGHRRAPHLRGTHADGVRAGDRNQRAHAAQLEAGRRQPEGPAIALLLIAACHLRIIRENLDSAA